MGSVTYYRESNPYYCNGGKEAGETTLNGITNFPSPNAH